MLKKNGIEYCSEGCAHAEECLFDDCPFTTHVSLVYFPGGQDGDYICPICGLVALPGMDEEVFCLGNETTGAHEPMALVKRLPTTPIPGIDP